jgi:hypothetical protein
LPGVRASLPLDPRRAQWRWELVQTLDTEWLVEIEIAVA